MAHKAKQSNQSSPAVKYQPLVTFHHSFEQIQKLVGCIVFLYVRKEAQRLKREYFKLFVYLRNSPACCCEFS